eukprot:238125-Chlamydomonas_euryale.AAC.1
MQRRRRHLAGAKLEHDVLERLLPVHEDQHTLQRERMDQASNRVGFVRRWRHDKVVRQVRRHGGHQAGLDAAGGARGPRSRR